MQYRSSWIKPLMGWSLGFWELNFLAIFSEWLPHKTALIQTIHLDDKQQQQQQ